MLDSQIFGIVCLNQFLLKKKTQSNSIHWIYTEL